MKSFWKSVFAFFLGGLLGTVFGIAVGLFIFPYLFPPPIPNSVKLDDYKSVVIWCEQFSVLISPANLTRSGS